MGWWLRKSVKMGPLRINFSKRGIGMSAGVKGLRVGTGPRGPYIAGGRGGLYFREPLGRRRSSSRGGGQTTQVPLMVTTALPQQPLPPGYTPQMSPGQPGTYPPPFQSPFQPVQPPPPRAYHAYRTAMLSAISGAQALSWLLIFADSGTQSAANRTSFGLAGNLGMLLFLASCVVVAVLDWHGFVSLRGRIPWWRLSGAQKFWLMCAYIFLFEVMLAIYLVGAWIDWRRARALEPMQRRMQTAQLEAELGIAPETDGVCKSCGKPLQVGAQFCAYCRAPVEARPKICPVCAATALPDAMWCSSCGAALP
jgi:uncharacterized protein DUF4236/double zinc ribbon protein